MDYNQYIHLGIALTLVLSLMALLSFVLKKINNAQSGITGKNNRIKILEQRMIDTKNKVALIRCDNKDHLVILSQNGNTVIESMTIKAETALPHERSKKDIPVESL